VEIIPQWLDDLEDIVFSLALIWERQRLRFLQAGLAASIVVLGIEMADVQTSLAPTFASAALGSVGIWFTGSIFAQHLAPQHVAVPGPSPAERLKFSLSAPSSLGIPRLRAGVWPTLHSRQHSVSRQK